MKNDVNLMNHLYGMKFIKKDIGCSSKEHDGNIFNDNEVGDMMKAIKV